MTKICTKGGIEKGLDEFHVNNNHPSGRTPRCKVCRRITELCYKYGLTFESYQEMLERAGSVCEICEDWDKRLIVDHDHETDETRGLLCDSCNLGLGHFQDDVKRLQSAIIYLERED